MISLNKLKWFRIESVCQIALFASSILLCSERHQPVLATAAFGKMPHKMKMQSQYATIHSTWQPLLSCHWSHTPLSSHERSFLVSSWQPNTLLFSAENDNNNDFGVDVLTCVSYHCTPRVCQCIGCPYVVQQFSLAPIFGKHVDDDIILFWTLAKPFRTRVAYRTSIRLNTHKQELNDGTFVSLHYRHILWLRPCLIDMSINFSFGPSHARTTILS